MRKTLTKSNLDRTIKPDELFVTWKDGSKHRATFLICKSCHKQFLTHIDKSRPRQFCSRICFNREYNFNSLEGLRKRFNSQIQILPNGCWYWLGGKDSNGYGNIKYLNRQHGVHRISLFLFKSFNLNSELLACHHCDNPPCVNPDHLYPGNTLINIRDAALKGKMRPNKTSYQPGRTGDNGESSPCAKLSNDDAKWIRDNYLNPYYQYELAEIFNVTPPTISFIINRKTYKTA